MSTFKEIAYQIPVCVNTSETCRGKNYGFVAGSQKKASNKWDGCLIDKRDLADSTINQLVRL